MSRLFVLSIDGFQTQDLEFMGTLPNFSRILERAAIVKNVREIYPTLTYAIHTSIITGVTPDIHGIYHNSTPYIPNTETNWNVVGYNWKMFQSEIKCDTIVDAAKRKGLSTACVMWPVMGGQTPNHNLAEIWPNFCGTLRETYEKSCSPSVMDLYFDKYIACFDWKRSIDTDSYSIDIACDMIRRFKPQLMLEHSICLDYARHYTGNLSPKTFDTLRRVDGFVGQLIQAYKDAGIYEQTNFVFLGDHGQEQVDQQFNPNVLFVEEGLIRLNKEGIAESYDAFCYSNGYSALVCLKDPTDKLMRDKVYTLLKKIQADYPWFIEHIYTEDEARDQEHLSGDFQFVVEGRQGVVLGNDLSGPLSYKAGEPGINKYVSNHGYHPRKGPKPPFIAFGPDVREGIVVDGAHILDECPTLCKLLGVEMEGLMDQPLPILKSAGR